MAKMDETVGLVNAEIGSQDDVSKKDITSDETQPDMSSIVRDGMLDRLAQLDSAFRLPVSQFVDGIRRANKRTFWQDLRFLPITNIGALWKQKSHFLAFVSVITPTVTTFFTGFLSRHTNFAEFAVVLLWKNSTHYLSSQDIGVNLIVSLISFVVYYGISLFYFFIFRMTKLDDPYFHPQVYEKLRKVEYSIFNSFADQKFIWSHLYDFVKYFLMAPNEQRQELSKAVNFLVDEDRRWLKQRMEDLIAQNKELQKRNSDMQEVLDGTKITVQQQQLAFSEISKSHAKRMEYFAQYMNQVHLIHEKVRTGTLDFSDLDFTNFSVFQLNQETLFMVYNNKVSCGDILLEDALSKQFPIALAATNKAGQIYPVFEKHEVLVNEKNEKPRWFKRWIQSDHQENADVVDVNNLSKTISFRIDIQDQIIVFNFHPNEDSFLLEMFDRSVLGLEVIVECIQDACEFLYANGKFQKEVKENA